MAIVAAYIVHTSAVFGVCFHYRLIPSFGSTWERTDVDFQCPRGPSKRLRISSRLFIKVWVQIYKYKWWKGMTYYAHHTPSIPHVIRPLEIRCYSLRVGNAHVPDERQHTRDGRQWRPEDCESEGIMMMMIRCFGAADHTWYFVVGYCWHDGRLEGSF